MIGKTTVGVAALIAIGTGGLPAQMIRGVVVHGRTGEPLLDASVVLLDRSGTIKRGWLTDVDGVYELQAPEPGIYTLRAGGPGLETWDSQRITLTGESDIELLIRLLPQGESFGLEEFEYRRASLPGTFLVESDLRNKGRERFTDLLRFVPGVQVVPFDTSELGARYSQGPATILAPSRSLAGAISEGRRSGMTQNFTVRLVHGHSGSETAGVRMQLEGASNCPPVLHVDGRWWGPIDNVGGSAGPDYQVLPETVAAIEIYHRGEIPPEFDTGRDALCGVIVVWRKPNR